MIRRTHTVRGRRATGLYSIEGTRLIERALRAGMVPEAVLMSESVYRAADERSARLRDELDAADVAVHIAPDVVLKEMTEGRDLGAIMGLVPLPQPLSPADVIRHSNTQAALFLAGVDILDPGNAGALIRTAHAAGANAFLAVGTTDPFHPRATRISRGSIFRLPVIEYASAEAMMMTLRELSVTTVATAATGGVALPELPAVDGPSAVLMGNEGEGLPDEILRAVDTTVTIPMPEGVDSFAVNAAAAIVLYEIQRALWPRRPQEGEVSP